MYHEVSRLMRHVYNVTPLYNTVIQIVDSQFVGGVALFEIFTPIGSHVKEN